MNTPTDKPADPTITVRYAARKACTTPKKMAECLDELGVPVHPDGYFSLGMLFCAVRTNCDPTKARRAVRRSFKRSIAKHFGQPATRKAATR